MSKDKQSGKSVPLAVLGGRAVIGLAACGIVLGLLGGIMLGVRAIQLEAREQGVADREGQLLQREQALAEKEAAAAVDAALLRQLQERLVTLRGEDQELTERAAELRAMLASQTAELAAAREAKKSLHEEMVVARREAQAYQGATGKLAEVQAELATAERLLVRVRAEVEAGVKQQTKLMTDLAELRSRLQEGVGAHAAAAAAARRHRELTTELDEMQGRRGELQAELEDLANQRAEAAAVLAKDQRQIAELIRYLETRAKEKSQ